MPLDATDFSLPNLLAERLSAMGINPVPSSVVDEYKDKVIRNFSTSMRGRSLVRNGAAAWRALHVYGNFEVLELPRKHIGPTIDISAAPQAIIQLARRVSRELSDAEFELEWFYTDPILNVVSGGSKACLGIWDSGRIMAIAEHDGYEPAHCSADAPKRAFWRRCVDILWR
jgi:hypothetical protein